MMKKNTIFTAPRENHEQQNFGVKFYLKVPKCFSVIHISLELQRY